MPKLYVAYLLLAFAKQGVQHRHAGRCTVVHCQSQQARCAKFVQIGRLANRMCSLFGRRNNSQRNTLLQSYKPVLAEAEERLELLMQKPLQQTYS